MSPMLVTRELGRRYGRSWALTECNLEIPEGRIVGLVGPNGAGKTTLLDLLGGNLAPSAGTVTVLGEPPAPNPQHLAKVSYVAQGNPTYGGLTVDEHLRLGARLNPRWDRPAAEQRIRELRLEPGRRAARLSAGQRAQLALTMALAKRPELVLLDEPVAQLDPLARRDFLRSLMAAAAEDGVGVVLSSHLVADLERVCDYLILLVEARVRLAGDVDTILAGHQRLVGPRRDLRRLPADQHVVWSSQTERQTTLVVRTEGPIHDPGWTVSPVDLEELVLAYMESSASPTGHLEVR
jgi:ABC-2 type transport system ATP-binding protein